MPKNLYKNNQGKVICEIDTDNKNQIVLVNWKGFLRLDDLKNASEGIISKVKETGYSLVLIDNRQINGPWDSANDWYDQDWNPRAHEAGIKAMAVIYPKDIFTKLSLQNYADAVRNKDLFHFKIVESEEEGRYWLLHPF